MGMCVCTHGNNENVQMSTITVQQARMYVCNMHFSYCLGIANALDLTDRILPRLQMRPECVSLHECSSVYYSVVYTNACV